MNDPEMVIPSRNRKIAVAAPETVRGDDRRKESTAPLLQLLNNSAKRMSFHTPKGTLTAKVDAKTIGSRVGDARMVCFVMVSTPLATTYVAAYNDQMRPKGLENTNRPGL